LILRSLKRSHFWRRHPINARQNYVAQGICRRVQCKL